MTKKLIIATVSLIFTVLALPISVGAIETWHIETADTGQQYPTELGYDMNGNPAFVQCDYYSKPTQVVYRYKSSTGWTSELIGAGEGYPALAFTPTGQPAVVYYEGRPGNLIYAKRIAENEWEKTIIASNSFFGTNVSLEFNAAGQPCIAYVGNYNSALYYASFDGKDWKIQEVYTSYYSKFDPDLAFNGTTPAIAFSESGQGLKYAYQSGKIWVIQSVDSSEPSYWFDLNFRNGKPFIGYGANKKLKFAYFSNNNWIVKDIENPTGGASLDHYLSMQVEQHGNSHTIYIMHSNYVLNRTTTIELKTLTVKSDSDFAKDFTSQTLYSKNFGNIPPLLAGAIKDGNPSVVLLEFRAMRTTFISMQPDIQAVSSVAFGTVPMGEEPNRQVTITNNGSIDLSINKIVTPSAPFRITGDDFSVLAPGESRTINVYFEPTAAGTTYQDAITIRSNDPDEAEYRISLTGRTIGNSADLASVRFNNGSELTMESVVTEYSATVAYATESLRITPMAVDGYAKIQVNGKSILSGKDSEAISLMIGPNAITVDVTSEDGKVVKPYTLNITRRDSPDASLSALTVSAGELSPAFSPEIFTYTMTIPDGVSELSFTPAATQANSTVDLNGQPIVNGSTTEPLPIEVGSNTFTLDVLAPDGESMMIYEVTALRLPELDGLSLDHGVLTPGFNPYVLSYEAVVPNGVTAVTLTPSVEGDYSIYVNDKESAGSASLDLNAGDNEIAIKVISADEKIEREYTLLVKRLEGISCLMVGDTQAMISWNEYNMHVEISDASNPLYFDLPDGMSVKLNEKPVLDGISEIYNFSLGENAPMKIELISPECAETTIYELTVFRRPLLTSLTIADRSADLLKDQTIYASTVPFGIDSATVFATVEDNATITMEGNATFSGGNGSWTVENLRYGGNPVYLRLVSLDGTTTTIYTIYMLRKPVLESLSVNQGELDFKPNVHSYTVHVGGEIDSVTISASVIKDEKNDSFAGNVSIDDLPSYSNMAEETVVLSYGSNVIPVTIFRDDYVNTTYSVNIIREGGSSVTSVTVDPLSVNVVKGQTQTFTAIVTGMNDPAQTVTWSVAGNSSPGTQIDANGLLTVSADEASDKLTVTATATADPSKSGMAIVTVTNTAFVPVSAITGIPATLTAGTSLPLAGTVAPTGATNRTIVWSVLDSGTTGAYLSGQSLITTLTGTVIIRATIMNGLAEGLDFTQDFAITIHRVSSGGGTVSTPTYTANLSGGGNVRVSADLVSGVATVNLGSLSGSLDGGGSMVVDVPQIEGINSYRANLPSSAISGGGEGSLTMQTGLANMTIPDDMLSGIGLAGDVGITIGSADTSKMPDNVIEAIDGRPVIQLTLTVDDKPVAWNNPDAPVTISIPYIPTETELRNPESIVIWYIDGFGNAITIPNGRYDTATGMVTFRTTHFSDYAVAFHPVSFHDVTAVAWYQNSVSFIAARGITKGTGEGCFRPEDNLTRGEFLVLLMRAYDIAPEESATENFEDAGNAFYTGYLSAAKQLGISAGVGENLFAPGKDITRQEMFKLLYDTLKVIGQLPEGNAGKEITDFTDAEVIDAWARDAISVLIETGTIQGINNTLDPARAATRAEMSQLLYNLLGQ